MAHSGRKSADAKLALLIARGLSIRAAARRAGVSERTARRRQADPEFRESVAKLRSAMVSRAAGQLADSMRRAIKTLRENLESANGTVSNAAAKTLLEQTLKVAEITTLTERVEALERMLKGQGKT